MDRDVFWKGPPEPVTAWAGLTIKGEIMVESARLRPEDVIRFCGPPCKPIKVSIHYVPEPEEEKTNA